MEEPKSEKSVNEHIVDENALFDLAIQAVRSCSTESNTSSNETKLTLYGLYKRVTAGKLLTSPPSDSDADEDDGDKFVVEARPSAWNVVSRAKHDTWASYNGLSISQAKEKYVSKVAEVLQGVKYEEGNADPKAVFLSSLDSVSCTATKENGKKEDNEASSVLPAPESKRACETQRNQQSKVQLPSSSPVFSTSFSAPKTICNTSIPHVYPRGQLDMSCMDLCHAMGQCFHPRVIPDTLGSMLGGCMLTSLGAKLLYDSAKKHEKKLERLWLDKIPDTPILATSKGDALSTLRPLSLLHAIPTYSVRSAFDLYLRASNFPPNSEIVMTAIQIPSMVYLAAECHQIQVVPVDYHLDATNQDKLESTLVPPSIDEILQNVTDQTVAVMIIHPFGNILYSQQDMLKLKLALQQRERGSHIDLLEDCAQCFAGFPSTQTTAYVGSDFSDLSFFSFGTIKTCTALGGAMVLLRGNKEDKNSENEAKPRIHALASKMRALQQAYPLQSNVAYFRKCLLGCFMCILSCTPWIYGLLVFGVCSLVLTTDSGMSTTACFDQFVTTWLRSFGSVSLSSSSMSMEEKSKVRRDFLDSIRKRPSPALLATLYRRLLGYANATHGTCVSKRVVRVKRVMKLLQSQKDQSNGKCVGVPFANSPKEGHMHLHWLFPILVEDPSSVSGHMLSHGFDIPRGTSQLTCIDKQACPNAAWFMSKILYLPTTTAGGGSEAETRVMQGMVASIYQAAAASASMPKDAERDKIGQDERGMKTGGSGRMEESSRKLPCVSNNVDPVDRSNVKPSNKSSPFIFSPWTAIGLTFFFFVLWIVSIVVGHYGTVATSAANGSSGVSRPSSSMVVALFLVIFAMLSQMATYMLWTMVGMMVLVTLVNVFLSPKYLRSKALARHLHPLSESISSDDGKSRRNGEDTKGKLQASPATINGFHPVNEVQKDSKDSKLGQHQEHPSPLNRDHEQSKAFSLDDVKALSLPIIETEDKRRTVILTGATGFLGSLMLRDLLLNKNVLLGESGLDEAGEVFASNKSSGRVILLCRSKKGQSAHDRIVEFLQQPMFDFLRQTQNHLPAGVSVMESDVTLEGLGLSSANRKTLSGMNVTHVIHCAASVRFVQPLDDAAVSNITPALQLQALAMDLDDCVRFVHVSTSFVHGGRTGSSPTDARNVVQGNERTDALPEELFSLDPYDAEELYHSMMGTQSLASKAMHDLGFPNVYTFSKCICEHLLLRNQKSENRTIIMRPSIVGPAAISPWEGWAGSKPSTVIAAVCLFLGNQWSLWSFSGRHLALVPVDVAVRFMLAKAFATTEDTKQIYNVTWDTCASSDATVSTAKFTWNQLAEVTSQVGSIVGCYSRFTVSLAYYINIILIPWWDPSSETFAMLHDCFVEQPFRMLHWILSICGMSRKAKKISSLLRFLDLPLLFLHFSSSDFCFQSDLVPPDSFDGERYMVNCCLAAGAFTRDFVNSASGKTATGIDASPPHSTPRDGFSFYHVAGRYCQVVSSDLWWAMTQPKGNLIIRVAGFFLRKIFRVTTDRVTVDMGSFSAVQKVLREKQDGYLQKQKNEARHSNEEKQAATAPKAGPYLVLAPTHRSLFDFLILSFVCFSLPELGIPLPHICASDEFARIPLLGWLAQWAGAFFVQRRRSGKSDTNLVKKVGRLKKKHGKRDPLCFEVFIEGKRSRDRRFIPAKTGFLRCLQNTGGEHIIVPITISYERMPEQDAFVQELEHGRRMSLGLTRLFKWLLNVAKGNVNLGNVHIVAGSPVVMSEESCVSKTVRSVQEFQRQLVLVSDYHIRSGAKLLQIDSQTMEIALRHLGCCIWPRLKNTFDNSATDNLVTPTNPSLLWMVMLHCGHALAPLFLKSHPHWAQWLDPTLHQSSIRQHHHKSVDEESVKVLFLRLKHLLEQLEDDVTKTRQSLVAKGFKRIHESHLLQYTSERTNPFPRFVIDSALASSCAEHTACDKISSTHKCENNVDGMLREESGAFREGQDQQLHVSRAVRPLFTHETDKTKGSSGVRPDEESFGYWGFKDSRFVLNVNERGSKCVTMKGQRYRMSGRRLNRLVPFIEEEFGIKIDPAKLFLSPDVDNRSLSVKGDISTSKLEMLTKALEKEGRKAKHRVSTSATDCMRHGTGQTLADMYLLRSGLIHEMRLPDVVVWPVSEQEVVDITALAQREKWCLIPFGGGTNVSHSLWCPSKKIEPRPILSVDMKKMNRVLWVNEEDGIAHVEAGITGSVLVKEMEDRGLTIGHEPDSIEFSTLGGWIATKASGMKRNRYGNIEDIVKEVRVAGSNGMLWRHCTSFRSKGASTENKLSQKVVAGRSSTGIDFTSLLLGSEGCLGIITSAIIKVWPMPERKEYESIVFPSFESGLNFVKQVSKMNSMKPASVRLVDNKQFRLGQVMKEEPSSVVQRARVNFMKFFGNLVYRLESESVAGVTILFEGSVVEVNLQKTAIKVLSSKYGGLFAGECNGKAGYDLTFAVAYLRDFAMSYYCMGDSFETFVPWSRLEAVVTSTKERIRKEHRIRCLPGRPFVSCRVTQLYDEGACVYFYVCLYVENVPSPNIVFGEIEAAAREEIMANGGSLSHHHGVGKIRSSYMTQVNSSTVNDLLLDIKHSFDPDNVFGARNGVFALDQSNRH